ncbi:MutH/Sau3AI family endonuclease [Erysipelothrix rhusiopathiae]|nr:MutH/Sau3AI family endonuclease [Erysipelothrix rhusiopathiae]
MNKLEFTNEKIVLLLESILNKTLGEIDSKNVFQRTIDNPKITGIAGDVIEQSVLGMPGDNKQEPDILIDNIEYEVKTTGLRIHKKKNIFTAKEPMSITAVSPHSITEEDFYTSKFWQQIEHLLLIYYHYNSDTTVTSSGYKDFPIKGYQFLELEEDDIKKLKNDWETVRNFISYLQNNYENYESQYPRISSETRKDLMLIDTAPKWPNRPRFRFKRSFLSSIVNKHFGQELEQLPINFNTFQELDAYCDRLEMKHFNKSISKLLAYYKLEQKKVNKSIAERIVVRMFGGQSAKLNDIELFNKSGIIGKTITLTNKGKRTEDMKLFRIDFDEILDENITFEESTFYEYFSNHQILLIKFEEPNSNSELKENIFKGFERIAFSEEFISTHVKNTWIEIRNLVLTDRLIDVVQTNPDGTPIINKNGTLRSAPNFPKSLTNLVFVRGSGRDSNDKTLNINDINMYQQYIWIKGNYIANILNERERNDKK